VLCTLKNNCPNNFNATIVEVNITIIKSNTKWKVEENTWQIDVIKLSILINGDRRKCVQESCHTGISKAAM